MDIQRVFWLLLPVLLLADSKTAQTLTVCDALKALPKYRNRMVIIRGELLRTEEGTYLSAVDCQKPLVASGHTWEPEYAINLIPPDSPSVESSESFIASVRVDPASSKLLSRYADDSKTRIWITVRGRLETRLNFELVQWGDGKQRPYGDGHLNASPAQLVYEDMRDAVIRSSAPKK